MAWYAKPDGSLTDLVGPDGVPENKIFVPDGYVKLPPGISPGDGRDTWDAKANALVPYQGVDDPVATLEAQFSQLAPKHEGQPYLTDDVVESILSAKVEVKEALSSATPQDSLAVLRTLELPSEMQVDLQVIVESVERLLQSN